MPSRETDASAPETGREKPQMRPEDMPSYTPQGRDEPTGEDVAQELPSYTPQGRVDSDEPEKADEQGRQGGPSR
ncbi:hypothetical protein [Paludisphaera sp.]|uniref:hypothetical protein n=1 Tax=Paludisphaera sp. TaxID=2017432 RepID=UPI00301E39C8